MLVNSVNKRSTNDIYENLTVKIPKFKYLGDKFFLNLKFKYLQRNCNAYIFIKSLNFDKKYLRGPLNFNFQTLAIGMYLN